jgi:hypothetical protein
VRCGILGCAFVWRQRSNSESCGRVSISGPRSKSISSEGGLYRGHVVIVWSAVWCGPLPVWWRDLSLLGGAAAVVGVVRDVQSCLPGQDEGGLAGLCCVLLLANCHRLRELDMQDEKSSARCGDRLFL